MIYEGHDPGEATGGHHSLRFSSKEISFCGCPRPRAPPPTAAHAATQRGLPLKLLEKAQRCHTRLRSVSSVFTIFYFILAFNK
ncbi:unnamed protein product, partial [Brenthis ino]